MSLSIEIPYGQIEVFCKRRPIKSLAFFGSVIRNDFGPDSDIDVLVEFEDDARIGFFELGRMERELSELLNGRVDLNTPNSLSPYFRDQVLKEAEVQFDAS